MHVCTLTHKLCTWLCPQHVTSVEILRADTQGWLVRGGSRYSHRGISSNHLKVGVAVVTAVRRNLCAFHAARPIVRRSSSCRGVHHQARV